jgi:ER degradation enhancer, mannosidase alpha-like 1
VYINDSSLFAAMRQVDIDERRDPDVQLRFYVQEVQPMFGTLLHPEQDSLDITVTGYTASFGGDVSGSTAATRQPIRFNAGGGLSVKKDESNKFGCQVYDNTFENDVLLVYRGECTFIQKLVIAKNAGAAGVVVITEDEQGINPTASLEDMEAAGDLTDVAIVVLPRRTGRLVEDLMEQTLEQGLGQLMVVVGPQSPAEMTETKTTQEGDPGAQKQSNTHNILYLNGLPLLNTRLIV